MPDTELRELAGGGEEVDVDFFDVAAHGVADFA
jgi:hypothetical protein